MTKSRTTYSGALVLQALAKDHHYGFEIMDVTGLASGTVYPALRRFERDGLVRSSWEDEAAAHRSGRPRRRLYELTDSGRERLSAAIERFAAREKLFAPESSS